MSHDGYSKQKLLSVQALRGIAALLVVLFHLDAMFREGAPRSRDFGDFWARGFAGVDMFFVISGFIMVYVTQDLTPKLKNAGRFLYARITRIYPLWWVFALLMMAYFYTAYGQPAAPDKASGDGVFPYIAKSFFLLPQANDPVLGVGWTLIHEMLFYMLFAAGLLLPRKFLPVWLASWAAIIVLASVIWTPVKGHAGNLFELITSPINMEFILGAFVALWLSRERAGWTGYIFWIGLALFTTALLFNTPGRGQYFNWVRVAVYGLPCALIILGAVHLDRLNKLSVPGFLATLGDWSYSLYLSHLLVLLSLKRIWNMSALQGAIPDALKWGADGWLDNVAYIIVGLVASIIFAGISYHLIEKASLRLLRAKTLRS